MGTETMGVTLHPDQQGGFMALTEPRSPIIIAGQEFPEWREAGTWPVRASLLCVTIDEELAPPFLARLGGYLPGFLEDGTAVQFYITGATKVWEAWELTVIPEIHATEGRL
jgi:hypothetical protein